MRIVLFDVGGDVTDWSDSTVYVPYSVAIEHDGEVQVYPAHFVTLTPDLVFARDPAGGFVNLPTRSVRSIQVTVQELPADHDELRAEYPNAYQPWDSYTDSALRHVKEATTTLAVSARLHGRHPEHLVTKAREFGYELTHMLDTTQHEPEPEPESVKALLARRKPWPDYLVFLKPNVHEPYQVLSRYRISPEDVYRIGSWRFAARLTGRQVEESVVVDGIALRDDPDVERIERDPDRLAPHFRAPREQRVEGEYMVTVRPSSDRTTVAARAGVSPRPMFNDVNSNTFSADMTDDQVLALRRDPDVVYILDNETFEID